MFRKLKVLAESFTGECLYEVVIAVPASHVDLQRQAVKTAANEAGWKVLRLVNTAVAAMIAVFLPRQPSTRAIILDIGATRADATIVEAWQGVYEVKYTAGDPRLGGNAYNEELLKFFGHLSPADCSDPEAYSMHELCEYVKKSLSLGDTSQFKEGRVITRDEFEGMCGDIFCSTIGLISDVLRNANLDKDAVNEIILIGGSANIPKLRIMVSEFFGRPLNDLQCPELAALRGAALYAGFLSDRLFPYELLVLDMIPNALYLELLPNVMIQVWPGNTAVAQKRTTCILAGCDQLPRSLRLIQGDSKSERIVGAFDLTYFLTLPAWQRQSIELEVNSDLDGILNATLTATDVETGAIVTVPLDKECSSGLEMSPRSEGTDSSCDDLESYVHIARSLADDLPLKRQQELQGALDAAESWLNLDGQPANEDTFRLVELLVR
ncbi:heat shock protein 70 family [Aspergillus ambiguus]|uniref:heat shock protein 70 family n=1 Tax=Aspergillus ambiguus TaxID=176160 RepID=UPI003CCD13BC